MSCKNFTLTFYPASEQPSRPGDYLIYNQCDGYHLVEARFHEGNFQGFYWFVGDQVADSFYRAWAKLPNSAVELHAAFAAKAR